MRAAQATQHSTLELLEYIERIVSGEQKHDGISVRPAEGRSVRLMNLHKAKGLEWHRVYWMRPVPRFRFDKKEWQIEQERNLNYVAATRSKHELILVIE